MLGQRKSKPTVLSLVENFMFSSLMQWIQMTHGKDLKHKFMLFER